MQTVDQATGTPQYDQNDLNNISRLKELMRMGRMRLIINQSKKALLVVGNSDMGKTTLSQAMSGNQIKIKMDEDGEIHLSIDENDERRMGHNFVSETTIPNFFKVIKKVKSTKDGKHIESEETKSDDQDEYIWDLAGFCDTSWIQEIANAFYSSYLIQKIDYIKILFVTQESNLDGGNCKGFIDSLNTFAKMFQNVQHMQNSVAICVNKSMIFNERSVRRRLDGFLNCDQLSEEAKQIIINTQNSTLLFDRVRNENDEYLSDRGLYQKVQKAINEYIDIQNLKRTINGDIINMTVTQKAYQKSRGLLKQSQESLKELVSKITNYTNIVQTNMINDYQTNKTADQLMMTLQRRFNQGDNIVNHDFLKIRDQLLQSKNHYYRVFHFEDVSHLIQLCDRSELDKIDIHQLKEFTDNLFEIFQRNAYTDQIEKGFKDQHDQITQNIEFIIFLQAVNPVEGDLVNDNSSYLQDIKCNFIKFLAILREKEEHFINEYILDTKCQNFNFYQKFISILSEKKFEEPVQGSKMKEETRTEAQLLKNQCFIEQSRIKFSQKQYNDCANLIRKTVYKFKQLPETYQKRVFNALVKIIYLDHSYIDSYKYDGEVFTKLYGLFKNSMHVSVMRSTNYIKMINTDNLSKYADKEINLILDLNQLRKLLTKLKQTCSNDKQNDQMKHILQQHQTLFDLVQGCIIKNKLSDRSDKELTKEIQTVKIEMDKNIRAFKLLNQKRAKYIQSNAGKGELKFMRPEDFSNGSIGWFKYLDETLNFIVDHQKSLTQKIDIDLKKYATITDDELPYSEEELNNIIEMTKLMKKNKKAQRICGLAHICKGRNIQHGDPQNQQQNKNKLAIDYYYNALKYDNGLNPARELIANIQKENGKYEYASEYYRQINNFKEAELCLKKLIEFSSNKKEYPLNLEKLADFQFKIGKYYDAKTTYMDAIQVYSSMEWGYDEDACQGLFQKIDRVCQDEKEGKNVFKNQAAFKNKIYPQTLEDPNEDQEIYDD